MRGLILVAAGAMGIFAVPALAADGPVADALPAESMVVATPANDWSGFHLGALLGHSWGSADAGDSGDIDFRGIDGGAYAGANWQFGNFVLGGEADVMASGLDGSEDGLEVNQGLNGSLRARAGIALDQFLLYGTGGVAVSDVELDRGGQSDDAALWGWTAGAGAEAMVLENVTARVEYRYSEYEDETFTLGGESVDSDLNTHSLRAGVGFKF